MLFISQVCVFVLLAFAVDAQQRVQRATGKNCPRNIDFPKGLTCKKCLKYRRKGTKATFRCPSGYRRYGNKFVVCRQDNTWNGDPPVCVKSGCTPIDSNDVNLVMALHPKFKDAVITFQCEEDYLLFGATEIHCDGVQWSHAPPSCKAISDLMECDFETDLCGWTLGHTVIGNQNWTRHIGSTQTGGTGPKRDHTFPNSDTGHYMYFESSSPALEGDEAVLVSPPYTADFSPMCFEFWYHMLGPQEEGHVGSLAVYVKDQSAELEHLQPTFYKEGNQGDIWHKGDIYIDSMVESYEIVIKVTKKKSYISDIAIDDVRLHNCTLTTTSTTTSTTIASTALSSTIGPIDVSTYASTVVSSHLSKITQPPVTTINTRSANNGTQQPVTQSPSSVSTHMSVDGSTETAPIKPVTSYTGSPKSAIPAVNTASNIVTETVRNVTSQNNMTEAPPLWTTEQPTSRSVTLDTESTKPITTARPSVQTTIITQKVHTQAIKTTMTSKIPTTFMMTTLIPRTNVTTQSPTTVTSKPTRTPTSRPLPTETMTTKRPLPTQTLTTQITLPTQTMTTKRPSTREITTTPTVMTTTGKRTTTSTLMPSTSETTPSTPVSTLTIKSSTSSVSSYVSSSVSPTTTSLVSTTNTRQVSHSASTHSALITTFLTGPSNQTQSMTTSLPVSTNKSDKGDNSSVSVRSKHPADETLKPLMIGLGVGIIVGLIIIGVIGWVCMRRRKFYTSRYEDELKPITNAASTQSLNNVDYYQDDFDIEHVQ